MDVWAYCIRQTKYLQTGEGKNLFRDQQPLAVQTAVRLQQAAETVARKYMADDESPDVIRALEAYARANPIRGVFAHEVSESFSAGGKGKSLLTQIIDMPFALTRGSRDVLDPTSSLAQAVDRFRELMEDYPALVRWQTQLLWLELESSTSFQTTMKGIDSLSRNSQRLAAIAESLPQQVRKDAFARAIRLPARSAHPLNRHYHCPALRGRYGRFHGRGGHSDRTTRHRGCGLEKS